jgi:hypothetical protein
MKTPKARLDADRTAKPKTRLVNRNAVPGQCVVGSATHIEQEDGRRVALGIVPVSDVLDEVLEADRQVRELKAALASLIACVRVNVTHLAHGKDDLKVIKNLTEAADRAERHLK